MLAVRGCEAILSSASICEQVRVPSPAEETANDESYEAVWLVETNIEKRFF